MDIELAKKITIIADAIEGNKEDLGFFLRRKSELEEGDGFLSELNFHMVKNKRTARRIYLTEEETLFILNNRIATLQKTVKSLEDQLNQINKEP